MGPEGVAADQQLVLWSQPVFVLADDGHGWRLFRHLCVAAHLGVDRGAIRDRVVVLVIAAIAVCVILLQLLNVLWSTTPSGCGLGMPSLFLLSYPRHIRW